MSYLIGQHEQPLLEIVGFYSSWLLLGSPGSPPRLPLSLHSCSSQCDWHGWEGICCMRSHNCPLKSDQCEGNVNRNVNVFFTEQVVSTWERLTDSEGRWEGSCWGRCAVSQQPRQLPCIGILCCHYFPPAQEFFSAGVQPGACMANMQKARKG